ncbi:hypothetical protein L211DRAFT_139460 [Terfezia boudieri ATCC MYA-4762]|uniref:Uncharacterized protein n=1 Tax=Terfezia boudieri ATCC MYA-4762 TaxID=1051890 RepID=A0A3N4LU95_9PEZI|nr:hypothetical protein L211DRAFT_139460 [Terfezia boudieri ATCC MYA-4762]
MQNSAGAKQEYMSSPGHEDFRNKYQKSVNSGMCFKAAWGRPKMAATTLLGGPLMEIPWRPLYRCQYHILQDPWDSFYSS